MDKKYVVDLYRNAKVYPDKITFIESYFSSKTEAAVLDVGFYGQGFGIDEPNWPHNIIRHHAQKCAGLDIVPELDELREEGMDYFRMCAENFSLDEKFDVIYAGDLIEHLSNPGQFLDCCIKHIKPGGEIVGSTPNPYFLTSILQKLTYRLEPSVNHEHTCFINLPTFSELVSRHGLRIERLDLLSRLGTASVPGYLMRMAHCIYRGVSLFTKKYSETYMFILVQTGFQAES